MFISDIQSFRLDIDLGRCIDYDLTVLIISFNEFPAADLARDTIMVTLSQLRPKQSGTIISVLGSSPVAGRLLAMGILPGAVVRVLGVAPLGDPMLVECNDCRLSLRREEAASLEIRGN